MRCFIAVDIDQEIKEKIMTLQSELPRKGVKIVGPDNLHFTMKFIGECNEDDANYIEESLIREIPKNTRFSVKLSGISVFPNEKNIKVIWIGAPELSELMEKIRKALSRWPDDHSTIPHLTLARVRSPESKQEIQSFLKKHKNDSFGTTIIKTVKLKKSTLTPQGPIYEDLKTFELS
ncbi:RNA 2',3'-cyclic phosphodiesterase [Candidatus Aenigmatarchaeota archaeon]